jgi:Zn-dependent protease/CBS domain-containing protein
MVRSGPFQLARIFGIRIGVSASWFFVLFVLIWALSGQFRDELGSDTQGYAVAVASALLFFASLVVHELGHALTARRLGIEIEGIDLWFFGGIARMSRDTESPGDDFKVAAAGPLFTLGVIAVCVGVGIAVSSADHFYDVATLGSGVKATAGLVLLSWLALINGVLFIFNMVPAYPLDGGRMARAIAWKLTGDRNRATHASAQVGRGFAMLLGAVGLVVLLMPKGSVTSGLWLIVLAMFLNQAARGAMLHSAFSQRIKDVTVADIMDREPVTVPGGTTLLDAQERFFLRYRWPWFAVVDEVGHYVGLLRAERVEHELSDGRPALTAAEVSDDDTPWRIDVTATLESLLGSEGLSRLGAVVAVDSEGFLRGVVTLAQVRRALTPTTGV